MFSLSDVQSFDLGSYKKGETRSLTLSTPAPSKSNAPFIPR